MTDKKPLLSETKYGAFVEGEPVPREILQDDVNSYAAHYDGAVLLQYDLDPDVPAIESPIGEYHVELRQGEVQMTYEGFFSTNAIERYVFTPYELFNAVRNDNENAQEVRSMREHMEDAVSDMYEMTAEYMDVEQDRDRLRRLNSELHTRVDNLHGKISTMNVKLERTEQSLTHWLQQAAALESSKQDLVDSMKRQSELCENQEENIATLQDEIRRLDKKHEDSVLNGIELRRQRDGLNANIKSMTERNEKQAVTIGEYKDNIQQLTEKLNRREQQISRQAHTINRSDNDHRQLQDQLRSKETLIEGQAKRITDLVSLQNRFQQNLMDRNEELREMRSSRDSLRKRLEALMAENDQKTLETMQVNRAAAAVNLKYAHLEQLYEDIQKRTLTAGATEQAHKQCQMWAEEIKRIVEKMAADPSVRMLPTILAYVNQLLEAARRT